MTGRQAAESASGTRFGATNTELTRNASAIIASFYARVMSQKAAMGALPILRAATDPAALGGVTFPV